MQILLDNMINPRYKNNSIIFISKRMVFKTQTSVKMQITLNNFLT